MKLTKRLTSKPLGWFDEHGMFDVENLDLGQYPSINERQAQRPDIFLMKQGWPKSQRTGPPYWCEDFRAARRTWASISFEDFKKAYGAVRFANRHKLMLDTLVTLHLERLATDSFQSRDPEVLGQIHSGFIRHLNQWLKDHRLPNLHIGVTENGRVHGLHTHIMLYLPGTTEVRALLGIDGGGIRREFRKWAKTYPSRNFGLEGTDYIEVSRINKERLMDQWIHFHYLMKGVARDEIVVQATHHPSGQNLMLDQLVARSPKPMGPIPDKLHKLWISKELGPSHQARGYLSDRPWVVGQRKPDFHLQFGGREPAEKYVPTPFQSELDAGIRDVRRLFGAEFCDFVMQTTSRASSPVPDLIDRCQNGCSSERGTRILDEESPDFFASTQIGPIWYGGFSIKYRSLADHPDREM